MPLRFGVFEIFPELYELRRAGARVHLEPRVFEVLAYLIAHRDRVVIKQELLERLWPGEFVSESALSRAVRDARRALGDTGAKERWIQTVHGRGFRFAGAVAEVARPAGAAPAAAAPAVAVLPLEDLSGDSGQEFFADGMTAALITELARIPSLRVLSRTSSVRYKSSRPPLAQMARELGVEMIVEGTVLRVGGRVRVTAQLVRAATNEQLWAERYELELRDVLQVQAEVAAAIAREVKVQLTPQEALRLNSVRPVDPEVFLLDLEGRHFIVQRREEAFRKAVRCFERALARDPAYAPAHAGLAEAYAMLGNYGMLPPPEVHEPARRAAARALELDPGLAEAHRTLALLHWQFEFDWEAADREYRLALELDPHSALVRWWRGVFSGVQGRFAESLLELERALELDPLSLHVVALLGWMRYFAGRFADALPFYRSVLEVEPDHPLAHWFLGQALVELEQADQGARELEIAVVLSGRSSRLLGYLGYAYGRAGRDADARALLHELETRAAAGYVPAYFPALVEVGRGELESAVGHLERAWRQRDTMLRDLRVDPPWRALHGDPRYLGLLGRLRLVPPEAA